jgi:RNA 3'-terminal phosphate cyclase
LTVYPCGSARPNASNLNYTPGETIPNNVVVKVGAGGKVCLFSEQTTNLIADVNGALTGGGYASFNPARLLDTRVGGATVDGLFATGTKLAGGQEIALQVTGRGGVPGGVVAVVLNVTVTDPQAGGYLTVYPCGSPRPNASNLNYSPGKTIPNNVVVKVGVGGKVCLFSEQTTNLIADVNGALT